MKRKLTLAVATLFAIITISSCGDKKSSIASKNIKVEVTTTNFSTGDNFLCVVAAGAAGSKDVKVNGVTRSNESAITLTKNDLVNNKVVIETAENAVVLSMTVGGTSDATPYTITVNPTVKGVAKEATTFTVTDESTSRSLTYQ